MFWLFLLALFGSPTAVDVARAYAPDRFLLNDESRLEQDVWNASYPQSVERVNESAMSLGSNSAAVVSCERCTQYKFEFIPSLREGTDMRVLFRTTETDYTKDNKRGIALTFSSTGLKISDNGREVASIDSVKLIERKAERIVIENFAQYYSVTLGCERIYYGTTSLLPSDAVVFETLNGTAAEIQHIVRNNFVNDIDKKH
jgi:hypothetical protein